MAQYDVYPNPTGTQRSVVPFVVVLQSDQLAHHNTRLVMPLMRLPRAPVASPRRLATTVDVLGELLYLGAHQCAALPVSQLKLPILSLKNQSTQLSDALNAVISGV